MDFNYTTYTHTHTHQSRRLVKLKFAKIQCKFCHCASQVACPVVYSATMFCLLPCSVCYHVLSASVYTSHVYTGVTSDQCPPYSVCFYVYLSRVQRRYQCPPCSVEWFYWCVMCTRTQDFPFRVGAKHLPCQCRLKVPSASFMVISRVQPQRKGKQRLSSSKPVCYIFCYYILSLC